MTGYEVHWRGRASFAEVAEALRVPTDHIIGTVPEGDRIAVMWTPDLSDVDSALSVVLGRDDDGLLVMAGEPTPVEFDVRAAIKAALRDALGDPS